MNTKATIRDRIKELRRVRASELLPHPQNWRTHPDNQRAALRGILVEIGYADALLVRETSDGLQIIDGHLRAEITPDQKVPVLILDVTEEEAAGSTLLEKGLGAFRSRRDVTIRRRVP